MSDAMANGATPDSRIASALAEARSGMVPGVRFTPEVVDAANEAWGFNCGPGSLCGLLGMHPEEVRRHMGDFEKKGYTNPTLMYGALASLGVAFTKTIDSTPMGTKRLRFPEFGLARIQWGGPWCRPAAPPQARYRQTHWVASCRAVEPSAIFDVNACKWMRLRDWEDLVVPWLLKDYPRSDGTWWVTHALEMA